MIVCLYGASTAAFVEGVALDLAAAAHGAGGAIAPLTIERALAERARDRTCWVDIRRVYVLPFDTPASLPAAAPRSPALLLRWLFPGAEIANAFEVHETCWDKRRLVERWLDRGVRVPESALTASVEEAAAFAQRHEWVLLKAAHGGGGHGHYAITAVADGLVAEARGQRYELELALAGARPHIRDRTLHYPGPFFLQRLVTERSTRRTLEPAQLLRAHIVDGQLVFWLERYREQYRCPSDWIVGGGPGVKYRVVLNVGEEVRKLALRAAEVISLRFGIVDIARTGRDGAYVLAAYSDGHHLLIDREYKRRPEFREAFDFDRFIAEALLVEPAPATVPEPPAVPERPRRRLPISRERAPRRPPRRA
jgi:hypothetical protein